MNKQHEKHSGGSLSVNTVWAVLGNLFFAGGRFLIFMILAKTFSEQQVGRFVLALAIVTPLSFLLNMELRLVLVTDTRGEVKAGYCLGTRIASNLLLVMVLGLGCVLMRSLCGWQWNQCVILLLAGGVRMVESIADIAIAVLQKYERMKNVAISQMLKTLGVLLCAVGVAHWADNLIWVLLGWLLMVGGVFWFYDRRRAGRYVSMKVCWRQSEVVRLCKQAFPLGVFVTITTFHEGVSRYFVAHYQGEAVVAYFATMLFVMAGAASVQNGVNQAVLPRLARYYAGNISDFWKLLGKVLGGSWLVMLAGLLVVAWQGRRIVALIARPEYAEYLYSPQRQSVWPIFVIVVLGGCLTLTSMILGDAIVACHRYKSRMIAVALGAVVNIGVCWRYIPDYGLKAAAWAGVVSAGVIVLICVSVLLLSVERKKG